VNASGAAGGENGALAKVPASALAPAPVPASTQSLPNTPWTAAPPFPLSPLCPPPPPSLAVAATTVATATVLDEAVKVCCVAGTGCHGEPSVYCTFDASVCPLPSCRLANFTSTAKLNKRTADPFFGGTKLAAIVSTEVGFVGGHVSFTWERQARALSDDSLRCAENARRRQQVKQAAGLYIGSYALMRAPRQPKDPASYISNSQQSRAALRYREHPRATTQSGECCRHIWKLAAERWSVAIG
jgi:hypothetical protein